MPDSSKNSGGFIKGQFESCPRCGELVVKDLSGCRHCGWIRDEGVLVAPESFPPPPVRAPDDELETIPPPEQYCTSYTKYGRAIPPEYPPDFNPDEFSWPAFWFADLWYAEKGLLKLASKHFKFRLVATLSLAISFILLFSVSDTPDSSTAAAVLSGLLFLVWIIGIVATGIISINDGKSAYRKYTEFYHDSCRRGDFEEVRDSGVKAYWSMLYIPFAFFTAAFLVMLMTVSLTQK